MTAPIEQLSKYILLEAERGFDNRAVVGGLDRILSSWRQEAQEAGLPLGIIEAVGSRLRDYPKLSPQSREVALQGLWSRIEAEVEDLSNVSNPFGSRASTPASDSETASEPEAEAEPHQQQTKPDVEGTPPARGRQAALSAPLTTIPGIGPKSAKTLAKLGLETLGDLLWHLPRRYDDYSKLKTINRLWYGEEVTIIGSIEDIKVRPVRSGKMKLVEAVIGDGTGSLRVTWFNQAWIANRLTPGKAVVLSGKIDQYLGKLTMNSPDWEPLNREQLHTNRIVPVYPLTAGITQKWLRRVMNSVVSRLAPRIDDPVPESVRNSASLVDLPRALNQVHFPDDWKSLEVAQKRLAFDEMFFLQLGVLRQKSSWEALETPPLSVPDDWIGQFKTNLPFQLTGRQLEILNELRSDLATGRPMNRLLQGDVGSGKTVLAAAAIGIAHAGGSQSALMAPTSILADQHYLSLREILPAAAGVQADSIRLLIGSTPESEKEAIRTGLVAGEVKVVIGTHALLESPVQFESFGLAIIDEQHRFGVEQRAALRAKGENPNLLVMTATPIPRSLALTLYGDLDLSVLDEMPPGRRPVETRVLLPSERSRAYAFINRELEKGRQAFVIYPLVESSEKVDALSAVEEHERLSNEVFPERRLAVLHGRLSADEKDETMARFRDGETDILVSTSVVEVGLDIPNASVMLIDGASRFGLSQLHQFRGRVGRGDHKSYCLLIPEDQENMDNERLSAMEATTDGFELAEMDLEQRGPGDFFGTRQSGFMELKLASLTDVRLIETARREASTIFEADPDLSKDEHKSLSQAVDRFWDSGGGEIS